MEHIEEAGVHSGDSACCLPPHSLPEAITAEIERQTLALAEGLGIIGLMNVQFAVQAGQIYILEVNPRASRTVPFVSKAIGQPLARFAARAMVGETLEQIGFTSPVRPSHFAVKEAILPFEKFRGVDTLLGPEMKSTGEVMGIDRSFPRAFLKAQEAASSPIPAKGRVFISVRDADKPGAAELARRFVNAGFSVVATSGTAAAIESAGVPVVRVNKVKEGRPHIVDHLINREIALVVNTTAGTEAIEDSRSIRAATLQTRTSYYTTIAAAKAAVDALVDRAVDSTIAVRTLQQYHAAIAR